MNKKIINNQLIDSYVEHLYNEEKSTATVEKYRRDIKAFTQFAERKNVTKELMISYKQSLINQGYAERSINSMLASLNSFLKYCGWTECKIKNIRQQRKIYCAEEKELSRAEYVRLLEAAKDQPKLNLLIKTICGTGIRVSELQFFTVENINRGEILINCKGKTRTILIPSKLQRILLQYSKKHEIKHGPVFITRNGNPLNRSNIWAQMKKLCEKAGVNPQKVFPHNLRKLFARTFYGLEKDIAKLADILGHSSIETTRIYIMSTGFEHRKKIENLRLVI
mgnify:CR=1 FL=1